MIVGTDLFKRLLQEINNTPAIDTHTHIPWRLPDSSPCATGLGDILFYHYIITELICAGMPAELLEPNRPLEERISKSLKYLPRIRNTTTYWCLAQILSDIYGFQDDISRMKVDGDPRLKALQCERPLEPDAQAAKGEAPSIEPGWRSLEETIKECRAREDWAQYVQKDKAHIEATFVTVEYWEAENWNLFKRHQENLGFRENPGFLGALRIDSLVATSNMREAMGKLQEASNTPIASLSHVKEALGKVIEKFIDGGRPAGKAWIVALAGSFPPEHEFQGLDHIDRLQAERVLQRILKGESRSAGSDSGAEIECDTGRGYNASARCEAKVLSDYIIHEILSLAQDYGLVVQLLLGIRRPMPGGKAITGFSPRTIAGLCRTFHDYPRVKFDIFLGSSVLSQDLVVAAKNYPNVYVGCNWWYNLNPTYIRNFLRERLELLPGNKINAFYSDAYCMEWSYAKAKLVRLQLAAVLAEKVIEGYMTEDAALELARMLLLENPKELYLGDHV